MLRLRELRMDWRAVVAIVSTTLLLTLDAYHEYFRSFFDTALGARLATQVLLYLVIPMFIVVVIFRESPARYGWRLGDWRAGLILTVGAWVALTALSFAVGRTADFQDYYGRSTSSSIPFWLADGIELVGWEFFFRGFLLFALYRACGPIALVLQAVPFAMAHIGKPELETLSCIFGGTGFAYVAWRTRSFLYPFLIHWFLASFISVIASGGLG